MEPVPRYSIYCTLSDRATVFDDNLVIGHLSPVTLGNIQPQQVTVVACQQRAKSLSMTGFKNILYVKTRV